MQVEIITPEFTVDEHRHRAVVKVGEQFIMLSQSDVFPPMETALCRITSPDADFDALSIFWCRSHVAIPEALEVLERMTQEQIDSLENDDPDMYVKALDFALGGGLQKLLCAL